MCELWWSLLLVGDHLSSGLLVVDHECEHRQLRQVSALLQLHHSLAELGGILLHASLLLKLLQLPCDLSKLLRAILDKISLVRLPERQLIRAVFQLQIALEFVLELRLGSQQLLLELMQLLVLRLDTLLFDLVYFQFKVQAL